VNGTNQSYEAFAFHPELGEEMVGGNLCVEYWKLCFQGGTGRLEIPLDQVVVELAEKGGQVWFSDREHPDVRFFTFDQSVLDDWALLRSRPVREQVKEILQRGDMARRCRIVLYAFFACILAAWLGSLAMGAAMHVVVNRIPLSWDAKEGDALIEKLEKKLPFVNDSNVVAQVIALAEPLVRAVPTNDVQFKFHVLAYPEPNAFALPGGHIVITTGLLKLAGRPEELLGVMAHEMAHVTQRHALRHQISGKGPIYLVQILTGGRSRALEALAFPSELLAYESFSQEYEREADVAGWNSLVSANLNPHGMIDMFRKLDKQEPKGEGGSGHSAFDSHPALEKRIAWLEAKWEKIPDKTNFVQLTNTVPKVSENDLQNSLERLLR
jgi:Zn-dependent protease with chaperone function